MQVAEGLLLSTEELSLLRRAVGADPPFAWDEPDLDDGAWTAVLHGLEARQLLVRDGDDASIAEWVRPVLGVALFAHRAITFTWDEDGKPQVVIFIRAGDATVEYQEVSEDVHRFAPADTARIGEFVLEHLPLSAGASTETGPPVSVSLRAFIEALELRDLDASIAALPQAEGLFRAMQECDVSLLIDQVLAGAPEGQAGERQLMFFNSAEHGLWLEDPRADDGLSVIQRVSLDEASRRVQELVR